MENNWTNLIYSREQRRITKKSWKLSTISMELQEI